MNPETIALIIKWGPLALMAVVFIYFFIVGVIRGTYRVIRRLVYVLLYVTLIFIFIDNIANIILDLNITINGIQGVRNFIVTTIESNESLNDFLAYSPELKTLIIDNPEVLVSPILFIVLVLVGLPLSFPIYWIYLIFWHIAMKCVLKREKYQKDEDGKFIRNEKGKKIKVRRRKRRLLGGLIRGTQGVLLLCVILLPVNFVNRLYNRAKKAAELENNETLCSSIEGANIGEDICNYLDIYNETIFAKMSGEKSLDKFISDGLTSVKVNGEKVVLENELGSVVESVVLINESGLLSLLMNGEINLDTLDLSSIDFDKINLALDKLFNSYTLSRLSEAGISYVLNEVLNDKLVEVLKDNDIVSKLEYSDANQIKEELKSVVNIIKYAVEEGIVDAAIDNKDNVVGIINEVDAKDVEALINKVLSVRIINKAMPSIIKAYGEQYGIQAPENMSEEINSEVAKLFSDTIKLVQTLELTNMEDLTEGNIAENLANALFEQGALKENSKEGLASLLNDINSSYLFKNVLSDQANKLLKDKDYKIDARVLKYVDSKESWLKELTVLEDAYLIYDEYQKNETIHYNKVTELLNDLSGTKVLISILPFAYDELLPKIGIEVDVNKLPSIEFGDENEETSKTEFYATWEEELIVLQNIASAAEDLELQSLEDISAEMLGDELKVEALSTMIGEIYKSDMLKEPFVEVLVSTVNDFVKDYKVSFTKAELLAIDTSEKWENEFTNINNILEIDFSEESNITSSNLEIIFNSINGMKLFENKKIEMLKYAINMSDFLTEEEYNSISWPSEGATQDEINDFWDNETSVLIDIVDKKDTIETLTTSLDLKIMNTTEIGGLLDRVMDSNILRNIVVNKVSKLLTENGVKDDRDQGTSVTELKNSIVGVTSWASELEMIQDMLTMTGETFDERNYYEIKASDRYLVNSDTYVQNDEGNYLKVGNNYYEIKITNKYTRALVEEEYVYTQSVLGTYLGVTNVEEMFKNIESSMLLKNTRANLLIKAITTLGIDGVNTNNVSVTSLTAKVGDETYYQYNNEVDVFVVFAENYQSVKNLSDITALNDRDKIVMGNVLDTMKYSEILKDKYVSTIDTALTKIKGNANLGASGYNVTFKGKAETNNYKNVLWVSEITNLTTIQDNIEKVSKYDETSIDTEEERTATLKVIGDTLDAIEKSAFLGANEADKIADAVVTKLTEKLPVKVTNVDKGEYDTWEEAFNAAL